jgi:outer membrane protein assembly factor BamA
VTLLSQHRVILLLLLLPVLTSSVFGQSNEQKIEVNRIDVTIDGDMSKQEVLNQLTTLETPMWLWIFLNENIYQKIGAPREYFNASLFKQDILQLRSHLRDNGYFRSEIDTSFDFSADQRSVDIGLTVRLNERSLIDTVLIHGLDSVPAEVVTSVLQRSPLKKGDPYSKRNVVEGQSSILRTMMNEGYPKIFLDTLSLIRYASTNNVSVMLTFAPGKRYRFGEIGFDHVDEDIDSTVMLRQIDFSLSATSIMKRNGSRVSRT